MRRKVTSFMLALLLTAAVPFTASAETVKSDKEMDVKFDGNKIESTFSTKDKAGDITLTSQITQADEKHKDMVTDVKATLK